ncbi:hypothetical protein LPMP_180870 [Leishmania panamensis]|uniref:Uncharacterized protein n=2 Tax=Leishmania guyanensis species complex TaxID=38579 RepID=A0A088RMX6_LEIPA|nr:hypothetical protein LPMP_180870 [Leishmania panamensis]AIN97268.1 hypothetical protein LPMP_180870 [Leishmania panamensis]CCM14474.1 hypothetical protein, conserved [Leishmania guyanensis]
MLRLLSLAAKVSTAVVVSLLTYRGVQLYFKNDITIYITEVVHLPTAAVQRGRQSSPKSDENLSVIIEGTVEMETCVMNSYRLLLKLAGHVRSSLFDANLNSTSLCSSRHRVLSVHASNATVDDFSFTRLSDNYGLSASSSHHSSGGTQRHGPSLVITNVDPIVDAYEADATGALVFTPACVGDGVLCRFTCVTSIGATEDAGSAPGRSGNFSSSLTPASSTVLSPQPSGNIGLGNIFVRSCFLGSDGEVAYGQRLTIELEFIRPVFGARVLIRLPSRHCRLHHSHTGGVGSVTQLLHQPRKCVWDIGAVSEEMCALSCNGTATLGSAEEVMEDNLVRSAVIPAASLSSVAKSLARLELVFEELPPALSFGEDGEEGEATDSADDNDSQFSSTSNAGSGVTHTPRRQSANARFISTQRCVSSTRRALTPMGNTTSRACKREERRRKANEKAARIQEGGNSISTRATGDEGVPTVEVVYSVNHLLSGTSVKKLQIVEERPNWTPQSRLDHLLIRRLVPGLEKLKLKKYAHYATWFVQPVVVSRL